jgi:hypothetical protein
VAKVIEACSELGRLLVFVLSNKHTHTASPNGAPLSWR